MSVHELMAQKAAIEQQLSSQFSILEANQSTMNTPLVDPEGFPRSDIDVWAVRQARVRIIELRNDSNALIDRIAIALQNHHAQNQSATGSTSQLINGVQDVAKAPELQPFVKVTEVAPRSPAEQAGLQKDDKILRFGHVTAQGGTLQAIGALVSGNENNTLEVVIERSSNAGKETIVLQLTPRSGWGGRGSLGCHIVPC